MPTPPPPTAPPRPLLLQAWAELRAHHHASVAHATSLDDTLAADGTGASLVRLHARLIARGIPRYRELPDPAQHLVRHHAAPPQAVSAQRPPHPTPARFDSKRAAAGDRDDD